MNYYLKIVCFISLFASSSVEPVKCKVPTFDEFEKVAFAIDMVEEQNKTSRLPSTEMAIAGTKRFLDNLIKQLCQYCLMKVSLFNASIPLQPHHF